MNIDSSILIVGHNDICEIALRDYLRGQGFKKVDSTSELAINPTIQASVYEYFQEYRPEYVFCGSTMSGGIQANINQSGEFLYHNSQSQNNILYAANKFGTQKVLYIGSSCVYPKEADQPIVEDSLLTGPVEKTSEAYAISKIAGIKLCQHFRRQYNFNAIVMIPATLYGPGQDMDQDKAHVLGALMSKFSEAAAEKKEKVVVWGTGEPRREFLYADDFAAACVFLMEHYNEEEIINVGVGEDVSIRELAECIAEGVGFKGQIDFDRSKPDGAMQKLLDNSKINKLGWRAKTKLKDGINVTIKSFKGAGV